MPAQPAPAAAQADQQPCAEHVNGADAAVPAIELATSAHHGGEHDKDCCKATACECACVHVSALDAPSLTINLVLIDQGRVPTFTPGLLEFLEASSLRPGCSGVITAASPDGTLTVEIDGRHVGVGAFASERILVTT